MAAGASFILDGTGDYINYGDVTAVDGLSTWTVSYWWYRPDDTLSTGRPIFSKWTNTANPHFYNYIPTSNRFVISMRTSATLFYNAYVPNFTTTVSNSVWHHFAWVWSGGNTHKVYFDGVLQSLTINNNSVLTTIQDTTDPLQIGAMNGSLIGKGNFSQFQIFSEAFTAAQVQEVMYNTEANTGTRKFWPDLMRANAQDQIQGTVPTLVGDATLSTNGAPVFLLGGR